MNIPIELAYLAVEVPAIAAVGDFFRDTIGLVEGAPTPSGARTFRNDARIHRLFVSEGPANDATAVGLEVADAAALDAVAARLRGLGYAVETGSAADLAERGVAGLVRTMAPWGRAVEIVHGLPSASSFAAPLFPGGFHTDGVGFGHVVFAAQDLEAASAFVTEGLGMERSDWIDMDMGGMPMTVRFFHCNARHHTIALAGLPFDLPQKLHHVMFETLDIDDVGAAFDRAVASGLPIPNGLGKHDNDRMFSFYVASPAGFQVEVGHGARSVIEPWTEDHAYSRISIWGHQPVTR